MSKHSFGAAYIDSNVQVGASLANLDTLKATVAYQLQADSTIAAEVRTRTWGGPRGWLHCSSGPSGVCDHLGDAGIEIRCRSEAFPFAPWRSSLPAQVLNLDDIYWVALGREGGREGYWGTMSPMRVRGQLEGLDHVRSASLPQLTHKLNGETSFAVGGVRKIESGTYKAKIDSKGICAMLYGTQVRSTLQSTASSPMCVWGSVEALTPMCVACPRVAAQQGHQGRVLGPVRHL